MLSQTMSSMGLPAVRLMLQGDTSKPTIMNISSAAAAGTAGAAEDAQHQRQAADMS
jgi:hypothetical protein